MESADRAETAEGRPAHKMGLGPVRGSDAALLCQFCPQRPAGDGQPQLDAVPQPAL